MASVSSMAIVCFCCCCCCCCCCLGWAALTSQTSCVRQRSDRQSSQYRIHCQVAPVPFRPTDSHATQHRIATRYGKPLTQSLICVLCHVSLVLCSFTPSLVSPLSSSTAFALHSPSSPHSPLFCATRSMVLNAIDELATGFEGCEKKVEIDFHLSSDDVDLRVIPRDALDSILDLAKCTIISMQRNADFDAYVLSESSLFIYPSKVMLKTCGTTLLLKCVSALLSAARSVGAQPDFLQFSRSNFLFPSKQHFPHRAFTEETDYLNEQLGIKGDAFILGSLNGARWHLYIWDFNALPATHYQQQTLEVIMFNLNTQKMNTFYKQQSANNSSASSDEQQQQVNELGVGHPCVDGEEATRVSGIDRLLPGSVIDSHLFTPCGYSCNGRVDVKDIDNIRASLSDGKVEESKQPHSSPSSPSSAQSNLPRVGKQGKHEQAYFTIHITPEPECSFVSFETNAVLPNYTPLVRHVVELFQPGSFCVSLFVDGGSDVSDSRSGLQWEHPGYVTRGTTHHAFQAGYNATVSQFEAKPSSELHLAPEFGAHALNHEPTVLAEEMADQSASTSTSSSSSSSLPAPNSKPWGNTPTLGGTVVPFSSPRPSPLSAHLILSGLNGMPTSYETVTSLSQEQMRAVTLEVVKQRHIDVQHLPSAAAAASPPDFSLNGDSAAATAGADGNSTSSPTSSSSVLLSSARSLLSNTSPDVGFTVIDLGAVARRFHSWSRTYPKVEPVYSLSAHSLPAGMAVALSALGCSFAVHSSLTLQHFLNLNIPASRLLFHLPLKSLAQLSYAHSQQVYHVNASATSDVHAIKQVHDSSKVWLHVKGKHADGIGFEVDEVGEAVRLCKTLELSVEGVHVDAGSIAEREEKEEGSHVRQLVDVAVAALAAAAKAGEELGAVHLDFPLPSSSSAASSLVKVLESAFPADVRVLGGARAFFDCELAVTCVRVLAVQPARQAGVKRVGYVHGSLSTVFTTNKRCKLEPFSADSDSDAVTTSSAQKDMLVSGVCVQESAIAPNTAAGEWLHTFPSLLQLEQLASKGPDAAPSHYIAS